MMNKQTIKNQAFNFSLFLCLCIVICGIYVIFSPNTSLHSIGVLCALTAFLVVINSSFINSIDILLQFREDLKLVDYQAWILAEIKKNNLTVIELVKSQAELLVDMTELASKKEEEK